MKNYWQKIEELLSGELDPAYRRRARLILKNLALVPGEKVLEVGCGRGFYLMAMEKICPQANIWGIDLNKKYLAIAKRITSKVRIITSDATQLPFKDGTFDKVMASEILEHIEDDTKAVTEIYRVLKPGGVAMISVPNKDYPLAWDPLNWLLERTIKRHMSSHIWWLAGLWADHVRLYSKEEIRERLADGGFEIKKIWATTHYCLPFSHLAFYGIGKNLVERGWIKSANRFDPDKKTSWLLKIILQTINRADRKNKNDTSRSSVNLVVRAVKPS